MEYNFNTNYTTRLDNIPYDKKIYFIRYNINLFSMSSLWDFTLYWFHSSYKYFVPKGTKRGERKSDMINQTISH
jgi:hypothetical protein